MARKFNFQLIPSPTVSGNMSSGVISNFTDLSNTESFAVQAEWTGSPVGTIKLQGSVNGSLFEDIPDSTLSVNGAGSNIWDGFSGTGCDKIQLVYVFSSGSGTLTAWISGKGLPD